jgi:hypothetical protein
MNMRRFTRLTNAFSKKIENLAYALALSLYLKLTHYPAPMSIPLTVRQEPAGTPPVPRVARSDLLCYM